ncbi:unnamed protein product [Linum trigynum]|uniref:Secreted peptide n=1 Tax=Linum trigynum TaxID=586398 RepID=A0AAV2ET49_9ROSI
MGGGNVSFLPLLILPIFLTLCLAAALLLILTLVSPKSSCSTQLQLSATNAVESSDGSNNNLSSSLPRSSLLISLTRLLVLISRLCFAERGGRAPHYVVVVVATTWGQSRCFLVSVNFSGFFRGHAL